MRLIFFITIFFIASNSAAQAIVDGDTSFSTFSAYSKAIKKFPDITIAREIQAKEIKKDTDVVYCTLGERKLLLDVFYSEKKNAADKIAVIIIHGGGWRSGHRRQHYPLAQRLVQLGYTCFTPEYRLSNEAIFPAAVLDIKAAIKWVKTKAAHYNTDTSKIVILGFSAGGELAAFAGVTGENIKFDNTQCNTYVSSKVNAIIDIDGTLSFVHPESSEGNDSKKLSAATQWIGVSKKDSLQLWQQASPLTYVNKNTPPTLFINSSAAPMHAGREDYIKVLNANNIYAEVHSFDNSPHTFCLFHPWFEPTVKYIDEFLKTVFVK